MGDSGIVIDKSQYVLPHDQPVAVLECTEAFKGLTVDEKLYAHYLSKAAWNGGLITLLQTSPESGPVFVFFHKLFLSNDPNDYRKVAVQAGFADDEVTAMFVYAAGVFANMGNYKGFGDTKFIPNIDRVRLMDLLKVASNWDQIKELWAEIGDAVYDITPGRICLGYPPHGCTTYFSRNFTSEDNAKVQDWMKKKGLESYNTRCMKYDSNGIVRYEVRLAGKDIGELINEEADGAIFTVVKGDYNKLLGRVSNALSDAVPYAANDNEAEMLRAYIRSFTSGSLEEHKDGSRFWIKDKAPAVETYIGFIETYRDPAGIRGEFEGFVAMVNREMSKKFTTLVEKAEEYLCLLPWSNGFEKDRFLRPDFTSLDVLSFAGSGIPAGINIPNYDDIRQTEGFKNVSLGNVIPASYGPSSNTPLPFLDASDVEYLEKYRIPAFEVQVGLHELLGHGSGKLFYKDSVTNTPNYPTTLLNPLTGAPPTSWYNTGDTYDSCFGPLSSSYEECRAEAVGLLLSLEEPVLAIFGHTDKQHAECVTYTNWLSLAWAGLNSLEMWEPNGGKGWLQAHAQARYVLMRVLINAGVVSVTETTDAGKPNLLLKMDAQAYRGAGRAAIAHFLLQLQVFKSTADVQSAKEMYGRLSEVQEQPWRQWREIVLANKRPRKIFVQPNTQRKTGNDNKGDNIEIISYPGNPEGLIRSWVERFEDVTELHAEILALAKADCKLFL